MGSEVSYLLSNMYHIHRPIYSQTLTVQCFHQLRNKEVFLQIQVVFFRCFSHNGVSIPNLTSLRIQGGPKVGLPKKN